MRSRPYIFNTCNEWVLGETVVTTDCGISLGEAKITDLDFADDFVIFAKALEVTVHALEKLNTEHKYSATSCCARRTCLLC